MILELQFRSKSNVSTKLVPSCKSDDERLPQYLVEVGHALDIAFGSFIAFLGLVELKLKLFDSCTLPVMM